MAANRVPAWKRLGLKLKSPGSQSEPLSIPNTFSNSVTPSRPSDEVDSSKRKRQPYIDPQTAKPSLKKSRTDDGQFNSPLTRQKSVTFAGESTPDQKPATPAKKADKAPPKKNKKKPAKTHKETKPQPPAVIPNLTGALDYLRRWKTSRDSWKFNKNHQTQLIHHVFDPTLFPASDIDTFYEYIRDLKGYIRTRLKETAKEVQASDMDKGKDNFPAGTSDADLKEEEYQKIMSRLLRSDSASSKRKRFDEMEFVRENEAVISQRVVKRMRAEMIMDELSNSDSDESAITTTTNSTTENEQSNQEAMDESDDADKRAKLNDGTTRPAKRIRASKRRGADVDDSSSDESSDEEDSEGESDEGTSSGSGSGSEESSSEEEDDSDDDMELDPNQETSSSSSSSSSDESDSDDEADG